jgi:hypothetical protein
LATEESFFGSAIGNGAELLRHNNTIQSAQAILRHIVHNRPLPLRIQQEIVDEHMDLGDTAAGEVLFRDLKAQARKHQEEMEEMIHRLEGANEETKKMLGEEIRKKQADMEKVLNDTRKLQQDFANEGQTSADDRRPGQRLGVLRFLEGDSTPNPDTFVAAISRHSLHFDARTPSNLFHHAIGKSLTL